MGYLDKIKETVNKMFESEKTADPEVIKQLATIKNELDNADKKIQDEQAAFNNKLNELTNDYKNLVLHTSFKDDSKTPQDPVASAPNFDDMLAQFIAK